MVTSKGLVKYNFENVERCLGMAVPKPQKLGIGMAVCKKDRTYTNNPIPTSFFVCGILLRIYIEIIEKQHCP